MLTDRPTNALLDLVLRKKRIGKVEAYRSLHNAMCYDQFSSAIAAGIAAGAIHEENINGIWYLCNAPSMPRYFGEDE